jgi:hypothetical protein
MANIKIGFDDISKMWNYHNSKAKNTQEYIFSDDLYNLILNNLYKPYICLSHLQISGELDLGGLVYEGKIYCLNTTFNDVRIEHFTATQKIYCKEVEFLGKIHSLIGKFEGKIIEGNF